VPGSNALKYMDGKIAEDYNWLVKNKAELNTQHISATQIDYLYMRSFFRDIAQQSQKNMIIILNRANNSGLNKTVITKHNLGLIYYRNGEEKFATGKYPSCPYWKMRQ
jgi:hypothetical protein